jgi:hypothetical protein
VGTLGGKGLQDALGALQDTDGPGADPGLVSAPSFPGKVAVEGDGAKEIGEGNLQRLGGITKDLFRKVSVTVMKGVEKGEKGCRLIPPQGDELFVRPDSHICLHKREDAAYPSLEPKLRG